MNLPAAAQSSQSPTGPLAELLRARRATLLQAEAGAVRDRAVRQELLMLLGRRQVDLPPARQIPLRPAGLPERRMPHIPGSLAGEWVVRFDAWGKHPLKALRARLEFELPMAWPEGPLSTLAAHLRAACRHHGLILLLVFDGFECHLAEPPTRLDIQRFDRELNEWLLDDTVPAHVLLVVAGAAAPGLARYAALAKALDGNTVRLVAPARSTPASPPSPPPSPLSPPIAAADEGLPAASAPPWREEPEAPVWRRRPAVVVVPFALLLAIGIGLAMWRPGGGGSPSPPVAAVRPPVPPADAPRAEVAPPALPSLPPLPVLTIALPPDAGSAATIVDELVLRVAAPAGLVLHRVPSRDQAALSVMRYDALASSQATAPGPLQVLAPLYTEEIQVLVQDDSPWRHLHQIERGRLNVGQADGARARTARTLYRLLFNRSLPAASNDELDVPAALPALLDGRLEAVVHVSSGSVFDGLPAATRQRLRVLTLDPRHRSSRRVLRTYLNVTHPGADGTGLGVVTFLVAPRRESTDNDVALRKLAAALCRAQPELQAQGSPLLRDLEPGQQPRVGWPYLAPVRAGATCPDMPDAGRRQANSDPPR